MSENLGKIVAISGSVVQVYFEHHLPPIYQALKVRNLVLEVQSYLDEHIIRALAMGDTQGLARGEKVIDLGHQIEVPVGKKTLGRMFNVLGQPIDEGSV